MFTQIDWSYSLTVMDKKIKSGELIIKSSRERRLHRSIKDAGPNSIGLSPKHYIRIRPADTSLSWAASWIADTNPTMFSRLRAQEQPNESLLREGQRRFPNLS